MDVLSARHVALARETGSLATLSSAYHVRAGVHLWAGEFAEAEAMAAEADSVSAAIGSSGMPYGTLALAVFRGRYADALAAAGQANEDPPVLWFAVSALAELIEAATRCGGPGRAAAAFSRLAGITSPCGTDWALGLEARCRALVTDGEAADRSYREAIDRLGRAGVRMEAARAQLLCGEWLRRRQRSREGRDQLRTAYEAFDSMGAEAFAERARAELRASGGSARKRADPQDALTAQEALIARLASSGASNPEIAAQLFLSPATVAYHLRKVYTKLGISSRSQLRLRASRPAQNAAAGQASLDRRRPGSRRD